MSVHDRFMKAWVLIDFFFSSPGTNASNVRALKSPVKTQPHKVDIYDDAPSNPLLAIAIPLIPFFPHSFSSWPLFTPFLPYDSSPLPVLLYMMLWLLPLSSRWFDYSPLPFLLFMTIALPNSLIRPPTWQITATFSFINDCSSSSPSWQVSFLVSLLHPIITAPLPPINDRSPSSPPCSLPFFYSWWLPFMTALLLISPWLLSFLPLRPLPFLTFMTALLPPLHDSFPSSTSWYWSLPSSPSWPLFFLPFMTALSFPHFMTLTTPFLPFMTALSHSL